ncbi:MULTISPECIES: ABC transporter ATP-binding protein [unclassified Arthrobacter]|uniref:ABC transporter ATP-binding protein n=1 Tax=unclassified Arthrobacter TaxID=235627 RepID=UPI001C852CC4|nr:ABC transporter ATP-binding protein [Arthrobacter sp. MAHUQ-56]MBX7444193.1 ABC transporter ATP-binding protein [Arthrobacter sp. MAHUQ-56]
MLSAHQLHAKGRRDPLLPPTTLAVARGELLLVTGERQDQRTALALLLSGRMKPTGGELGWDNSRRTKQLRLAAALVDSPGVNEPEEHLSVRDLVTEDLALIPRRYRGALLSGPWLKVNRFEDIAALWTEQLEPGRRLELLTALALANPRTDLLVVDSPDRHSADLDTWLPRLQELASDAGRPLAVVAAVSAVPAPWDGPVAVIGNAEAAETGQDPEDQEATEDQETELETEVAK